MKKVSVIMGVYNEKISWVKETINSILEQTYKNIELIVILDNPENQELKIFLDSYKDKIKFEVNDKNLGLVKTLNRAIDLANGEYIARIDADD
ncbi:MAG: glycosyltransferase, partial [Sarcina sp.]